MGGINCSSEDERSIISKVCMRERERWIDR